MSHGAGFPDGFLWGAATSAYQIEGSPLADGAGPSNWHAFSHTPGRVAGGDTGDVACDHYRRWPEDVALMRQLGLGAYRFSISWSRVLPVGRGRVNQAGLDFYRRLVEALNEAGIEPFATLYHWDLPLALEERGGWADDDVVGRFADYAEVVCRALDGGVRHWATLNEPWVVVDGGYLRGSLAPGRQEPAAAMRAAFNLMRGHAAAVDAYRAVGRHAVGLVVNLEPKTPASDDPADLDATARSDAEMNQLYLDLALRGTFPAELPAMLGEAWPTDAAELAAAIPRPLDFLGVNYYTRGVMQDDPGNPPYGASRVPAPGAPRTGTDWEIYPAGLTECLTWLTFRYGRLPLYVTENGAVFSDPPATTGVVEDPQRVAYLAEHLRAARRAIGTGVDLRGYFVWSLLDNLEWALGYAKRFGIVQVDFETQRRTLKRSAHFYADVIRSNGANLG